MILIGFKTRQSLVEQLPIEGTTSTIILHAVLECVVVDDVDEGAYNGLGVGGDGVCGGSGGQRVLRWVGFRVKGHIAVLVLVAMGL